MTAAAESATPPNMPEAGAAKAGVESSPVGRVPRRKETGPGYRMWACFGVKVGNLSGWGPIPTSGLGPLSLRTNGPLPAGNRVTTAPYGLMCMVLDGTDSGLW